jgi:hypothetical protein
MKFLRRLFFSTLAVGLATLALVTHADELRFRLAGDMEVPPVTTVAAGDAVINVSPDMAVNGMVATTGVVATMAHIHRGAPGVNGPVLISLEKVGDNGWAVPPGARLTDEQYRLYLAGELYLNVHSADHKGGEIRGQLKPSR